ncbi:protein kintoun [Elgaria multicarinata webbii]|uniref:protein kintoun n=1 Tax=Elgaria multicarinata webbii TaxID=159646 RepID=UPI002FCD2BD8
MASRSGLEDLELTGDEVERLTTAFQDEGFRTLFAQYAAELADPEQRAIYEAEVAALERQRGVEARFIHPAPGWVLRTSQAGTRRCYLNVCSNPLVGRPEARPEPGGSCWSLPHCLAPGREELSRRPRGARRLVYDVVFHPDTLRLAARSARFRRLVDDTALEAVEKHYSPGLDRANAVPLRGTKYKGVPQATLLRTPLPGDAPPPEAGEGGSPLLPPFPSPYAYPPAQPEREAQPPRPPPPAAAAAATTPRWTLRHRSYVDLQDYRNSRDSAPSPVPRELVVTIELPLLSSAAQAQLEIRGQELQLDSQRPAAYRLRLPLPYAVDEGGGRAAFNKAKKQLVVTLPVLAKPGSGAISDGQASPGQSEAPAEEEGDDEEEEEEPEPPRVGSGSVSPRERQEEEDDDDDAPADDSAELCPKPGSAKQAPPVSHEDANSASPPACAAEIPPAADPTRPAVPLCSDANGPAPLAAHVPPSCNSPELPACAWETVPTAPWAAGFSLLPPACNGNISPAVPTCSGVGLCVSREDTGSVSTAEVPVHPSSSPGPVTAVSPVDRCTCMDLNQCSDVLSPSCPSEDGSGQDVTTLLGLDCSKVDQRPALSTSTDLPVPTSHVELSVPAPSPGNRTATSPPVSTASPSTDTDTPVNSTSCLDSSMSPASSTPLPCPPFHCTQDEKALTLLLQVPGILPQSLKGEVGTNHYRVSFSNKASAAYSYFFQFLPENKLTPPEIRINVSPNNAVITLAKSPETTGVWTKLYFGPNVDALQERWFVTENNVDAFLSSLLRTTSHPSQSEIEQQPLLEVLDVSEGKSQIRIKAQEQNSCELGKAEERVNPRRGDGEQENGEGLSTGAENGPVQLERVSGSLTATETMGRVGKESGHCLLLDPSDPGLAIPEKLQISELHESELGFTTCKRVTSTLQTQRSWQKPAQTGEKEDAHSESAQDENELGSRPAPAPTALKETLEDGSVQYITHHTTHCAVAFQNALLYELD